VGLACCFDLRFPLLSNMLSLPPPHGLGCDILLYPSAWLASTGALGHWETLLRARALDGQVFVVGANQARREREGEGEGGGGENENEGPVLFGRSTLLGPLGETLSTCLLDTADEVVLADFSRGHLEHTRTVKINLAVAKRSPELYTNMLENAMEARSHPL
jgi:predicted amidohydrolase